MTKRDATFSIEILCSDGRKVVEHNVASYSLMLFKDKEPCPEHPGENRYTEGEHHEVDHPDMLRRVVEKVQEFQKELMN